MTEDFTPPKNVMTSDTLHTLAEIWADPVWRTYITNNRNQLIVSLRAIKTGSLEGDALELSHKNGKIAAIEDLIRFMKKAYEDVNKLTKRSIQDGVEIPNQHIN